MLFYSSVGWLKQLHFFFKVQLSAFRVYDKIKSAYSIPLQCFILKCIFYFWKSPSSSLSKLSVDLETCLQ